jgi:hypothetical protein
MRTFLPIVLIFSSLFSFGCATDKLWASGYSAENILVDSHWTPIECLIVRSDIIPDSGHLLIPFSNFDSGQLPHSSAILIFLETDAMRHVEEAQSLKVLAPLAAWESVVFQINNLTEAHLYDVDAFGNITLIVDGQPIAIGRCSFTHDSSIKKNLFPAFKGVIDLHMCGNYEAHPRAWWFYPLVPFAVAADIATCPFQAAYLLFIFHG